METVKRVLKEPLLHFLVLGALLFIGYEIANRGDSSSGQIVVTQGKIENLASTFARVWQRPPTPPELDGLIEDFVREEVLAREAMALGLDRDDTVIRRRLRQKMEFVADDLAVQTEPTDAELTEFLEEHPNLFGVEPIFSFRQVYLNPERRGNALKQGAAQLLARLNRSGANGDFANLGDSTLLSHRLTDVRASEVTDLFAEEFTQQLAQLPKGRWQGPVTSAYGIHLVFVEDRKEGRMPELSEVREQVAREWADARRREANEQFYQDLLERYAVTIESPPEPAQSDKRTARAP